MVDVDDLAEPDLVRVLDDVRAAQRCLDGLAVRVGARCDRLAASGEAAPPVDVLRGAGRVGSGQARREAGRVEAAVGIDGVADVLSRGDTTGEHVDVLVREWIRLDEAQRARFDTDVLLGEACRLPVETFRRVVKRHADAAVGDHGLADTVARQQASEFRHWFDASTGLGRFAGSLDPERYEMLCNRIEQRMTAMAADGGGEPVNKNPALAARALVDLVAGRAGRAGAPSITVLVDEQTLRSGPHVGSVIETENGVPLAPESVSRLCCDATLRRVVVDSRGVPIDVGRRHRTATDAQWAALRAMYPACAWDGCTAPVAWCQAHHILEWERGGATDLRNLVPFCHRHHHRVHEGRWRIRLLADRTLRIHRADGTHLTDTPAPCRQPIPAVANAPPRGGGP